MIVKISKSDWENIGKVNGWIKSSQSKPRVLLIELKGMWDISEDDLSNLKSICDLDWVQVDSDKMDEEDLAAKCEGYDHLMLNMDFLPSFPDKMDRLTDKFYSHKGVKNLKFLNADMTDADFFSPNLAKKAGITLQTCPNAVTTSVAESAVTEILMHARGRHLAYTDEIKGKDVECRKSIDLRGKTAGVIGYGNIGRQVVQVLKSMGMKVLVNDIKKDLGIEICPLDRMFKEAKVISIHIPALQNNSESTSNIGMIDEKLLSKCNEAILVNLATDIIVDNVAVNKALNRRNLIAYSVEPGRKITDNLRGVEGVHISPCSFDSDESRRNVLRIWIENTISAIKGNPKNVWGKVR
jgi:lactate dehydrogenase-like 2-hydroxyacid dehydrogenase